MLARPMRYLRGALAGLTLVAPAMAAFPAGTIIEVRLLTPVSSYSSKAGTEVRALVLGAVCPEAGIPVPSGTVVSGVVKRIRKVGLGLVYESARMEIEFRELTLPDGQSYPLQARLVSVDNARERVDGSGTIHGLRATASLSNRLGSQIALVALEHPFGLIPVFILENSLFRFPNPEIEYGSGTELHLELEAPVNSEVVSGCDATERVSQSESSAELDSLVATLPYWTYRERKRKPEDPTNLVFIGSRGEIERAFAAAGWTGSLSPSAATRLQAVRAIAENRGYRNAPMKTLLLDGAKPDITRQKTLNTFTRRDHLRIWKRPDLWHGRTVWVSAATKDIAANVSLRPFGFTHQIQNEVDLERNKVVTDLEFTGCVESVTFVERPEVSGSLGYPARKGLSTDGRVAVIVLNSCDKSLQAPVIAAENPDPAVAVRILRRIVLTARNHFLRDNRAWRTGEAAYLGFQAIRNWNEQRMGGRRERHIADDSAGPHERNNTPLVVLSAALHLIFRYHVAISPDIPADW